MILWAPRPSRKKLIAKNCLAFLSAISFLLASAVLSEEIGIAARYPVVFRDCSAGISADVYESYRLQMNLKEEPGAPMVFEAEHASQITLHGAERLGFVSDAAAGVAV
jgi:hypothetical protein